MRYSKQREAVLNSVLWNLEHPTADDVYADVKQELPKISLGTVYRDLNELVEIGQIKRVQIPGLADRYDKTLERHNHFLCTKCNKLFNVPASSINTINKIVEKEMGFELLSSDIVFKGICKDCKDDTILL